MKKFKYIIKYCIRLGGKAFTPNGSCLNNSSLKDRSILEDTLKGEARQVDASKLASGQQLSQRAARSGRLLESMARETVT